MSIPNQLFFAGAQTMARFLEPLPADHGRRVKSAYLGMSFLISGEIHYAWASVVFDVILTFGPPKLVAKLT